MPTARQRPSSGVQEGWPPRVAVAALVLLLLSFLFKQKTWEYVLPQSTPPNGRQACIPAAGSLQDPELEVAPGELWPGTPPMEHPGKATFDRLQADPSLAESDPSIAAEFEAAPWLLPPQTQVVNYSGVHDLDQLLQLRSRPAGNHTRAVVFLLFSKGIAVTAQNTIYSLVKFGGARNYLLGTWREEDRQACAELNLPCADISGLLPVRLKAAARRKGRDLTAIKWLRPIVAAHIVKRGYAVIVSDADVAWTMKPAWESLLGYAAANGADGVVQEAQHNGGAFMLLPTPQGKAAAAKWAAAARGAIAKGQDDQAWLAEHEDVAVRCSPPACFEVAPSNGSLPARLRSYPPGFLMLSRDPCLLEQREAPLLDYCDWAILHVHPSCTPLERKAAVFKWQGLWLVDDEEGCGPQPGSRNGVPACQPLRWRQPDAELMFYSCARYGPALWHERPPLKATATV